MNQHRHIRLLAASALVLVAGLLAACGGSSKSDAPAGSAQNPLIGQKSPSSEGSASAKSAEPGFSKIVERQTSKPQSRFTPCNLVTKAQAGAILRTKMIDPLEAPQGPTCIYRSRDNKNFVTVAVQTGKINRLKRQLADRETVQVSHRTAYCGRAGQTMLYLPLSQGRVLTIAARCPIARRFASTAVARLSD